MEVAQLWRWPVEGTDGESTPSVRVDVRGVGGDRTHAILTAADTGWSPVTVAGRRSAYPFAPGAALDPASPPYAVVRDADAGDWRCGVELRFEGGARLRVLAPLAGGGARARVLANGRIAAGEPCGLIAS
jgi:hypothetical protein